ncbi:CPBP family intramembrane glutamic endopeptidase [Roseateles amylovorans]|uniref:CPBP family intramembrane metalloprotease n=1 Tax=Roseateles amylovorans TaxID=2978473 RepID=A0ABY6ATQ0_9BURK|nr:CPBP family intramembrane glutamic endopeptidase [Roseateles amylovorans]UXH76601.1 CPBP family intramembrane metalloprotease [Roseateles amylovorans]
MSVMPLSHLLLCLAILLTLLPVTAPWPWMTVLIMAVTAGLIQGQLSIAALVPVLAMLALAWLAMSAHRQPRREATLMVLMLVLGLALSLHKLPGFANPSYLVASADALPPTVKYLNFDKGVAGLLMLAVLITQQRQRRNGGVTRWADQPGRPVSGHSAFGGWALPITVVATLAVPWWLAVGSGLGEPTLRWPPNAALFLLSNLFLTCVAEEVAFRGVIQQLLARWVSDDLRHWRGWIPVLLTALLFGLAHLAGGPVYVALAALAGLGYGLSYALSGRIEVAILLHFGLNALVFCTLNVKLG